MAREMAKTYKLNQKEIAKLLNITQTTVSKYITHKRGTLIKFENNGKIQDIIKKTASDLVNHNISIYELSKRICLICKAARSKRLMCKICQISNPTLIPENCFLCQ